MEVFYPFVYAAIQHVIFLDLLGMENRPVFQEYAGERIVEAGSIKLHPVQVEAPFDPQNLEGKLSTRTLNFAPYRPPAIISKLSICVPDLALRLRIS